MAPAEWHARFSQWLLSLAQHSLEAEDYPTSAEAALRGLQEVIDAHAAEEGFHFHDDYPYEGWSKRVEWLRQKAPIFEDALQRYVEALMLACVGRDFQSIKACVEELEGFVAELSARSLNTR
jgi:hypothetical protein